MKEGLDKLQESDNKFNVDRDGQKIIDQGKLVPDRKNSSSDNE